MKQGKDPKLVHTANGRQPDAPAPVDMKDEMTKIIFTHYIGQSPSRVKAEKCAVKLIDFLTNIYEAAAQSEQADPTPEVQG